jgi:hypothetical protein
MGLRQKRVNEAGITNPSRIPDEINDGARGDSYNSVPKGGSEIQESSNLVFTNRIIEGRPLNSANRLNLGDEGSVRPGTAG